MLKLFTFDCSNLGLFQPFLSSLISIKHLNIYPKIFEKILPIKNLTNLIQSQTQLSSFSLFSINITENVILSDSFKYLSSTLNSIKFDSCNFTNLLSFDGFKYLTQLKSLQFIWCHGLTTHIFQPLLDIPALKIKSLKVNSHQISGIGLLIQKVGNHLEHLELGIWEDTKRKKAFESIINYCDEIKFLHLSYIDLDNIPQLYETIIYINKHLKYLSFQIKYHGLNNENKLKLSSMILKGLGQTLSDSLEYLDLNFAIDSNDLKIFLDNCKQVVSLNKFLIRNWNNKKDVDVTLNVLKEFVREKKVKKFAYEVNCYSNHESSVYHNLEKLASETRNFTKMKRYGDLVVDFDIL